MNNTAVEVQLANTMQSPTTGLPSPGSVELQTNGSSATAASDDIASDDEQKFFPDSTHGYLVSNDHKCAGVIIGMLVVFMQFVLFTIIAGSGIESISNRDVPMTMNYDECRDFTETAADIDAFITAYSYNMTVYDQAWYSYYVTEKAACEAQPIKNFFWTFVLITALISVFLLADILSSCRVMWSPSRNTCSKCGGLIILSVTCFAYFCAVLFMTTAFFSQSAYDAVMNCVGVLFVADIDEKMFGALQIFVKSAEEGCACCGCLSCKRSCNCNACVGVLTRALCCIFFTMAGMLLATMIVYFSIQGVIFPAGNPNESWPAPATQPPTSFPTIA